MKKMLFAFFLNLAFSIFEFVGGIFTNSVAIMSDAVHDLGDAISIGVSCYLESKSKKKPDSNFTYGYLRYSILGALITSVVLVCGSLFVIANSTYRIFVPKEINYDGMLIFAIIGVAVNFIAAFITRDGDSLNQKAVNLHMLEDVLGWIVVLIGSLVMKFTNFSIIDSIMSIGIGVFILINAFKNVKDSVDVFLEKSPVDTDVKEIAEHIQSIGGVQDVHHLHVWTLDGNVNCATIHVVADDDIQNIKRFIREEFKEHGIQHVTIEIETSQDRCSEKECTINNQKKCGCCHAHHHHHHGHTNSHGHRHHH